MDATIKDGFYTDTTTNRTFFVRKGMIPPWVKSDRSKWRTTRVEKDNEPQFNSHDFEDMYKEMDVNVDKLGCIMLDLSPIGLPQFPGGEEHLYYAKDKSKFWIQGYVAGKTPHVTLLYGLMKPGLEWKEYVDKVLGSWKMDTIQIKEVGLFESNLKDEPYYCIVAHMEITPKLLEAHQRLSLLPHINTFPGYKAHFTLAYIKKDEKIRNLVISLLNQQLAGKELKVKEINYGGNKSE